MLPQKQRESIWDVADKLYPTFPELLVKVQKLIQDDIDQRQGVGPMEIDNVEEEHWEDTGEVLSGKGPDGEETLFVLQRRGTMTRLRPKGNGKGSKAGGRPGGGPAQAQKSSKWVKGGCARCGRGNHWTKECNAVKDIDGNPPREKPKERQGEG